MEAEGNMDFKAAFWSLIDVFGGSFTIEGMEEFEAELDGLSNDEHSTFELYMDDYLVALTSEPVLGHIERWMAEQAEPVDGGARGLACAVIMAGRSACEAVLANPQALWDRDWDTSGGEAILNELVVSVPGGYNLFDPSRPLWLAVSLAESDPSLWRNNDQVDAASEAGSRLSGEAQWLDWALATGFEICVLSLLFKDIAAPGKMKVVKYGQQFHPERELPLSLVPREATVEAWEPIVRENLQQAADALAASKKSFKPRA